MLQIRYAEVAFRSEYKNYFNVFGHPVELLVKMICKNTSLPYSYLGAIFH